MTFFPAKEYKPFIPEDPPMFEKGIRQCLYWAYAMQGVDPHERTAHCKLMLKMRDGYLQNFEPKTIHLEGMTELQRFGEAAKMRQRVEALIDDHQKHFIWAKYADINVPEKMIGMLYVTRHFAPIIKRNLSVTSDIVGYVVSTEYQRSLGSMYAIADLHGVSHDSIYRGVTRVKKYFARVEESALDIIRPIFHLRGIV